MNGSKQPTWEHFKKSYSEFPSINLALDLSRMDFPKGFMQKMEPAIQKAFAEMGSLEKGSMANPDEKRMVGHYWLRDPSLAPTSEIRSEIKRTIDRIKSFAKSVHDGSIHGKGGSFENYLLIGIGGSALGPQFVSSALSRTGNDKCRPFFFDNTDPDGMNHILAQIGVKLSQTLCLVVSKSGGTKETRNGMLVAKAAYKAAGLNFGKHAVAVTQIGSELDKIAVEGGWLDQFPMWDWVGGRTSELSAVGLLPAALQGIDIEQLLAGAKACDEVTRFSEVRRNPAAQLALAWYHAGDGQGAKSMVIIPYKDRLALFSRYLQQLIMESLGKELDLSGKVVNQGISVFGNKGSTDQHSYIQQLRDGINNFFLTFLEVLTDEDCPPVMVEDNVTSGDYLHGFYLGTRQALWENGRESITLTVREVSPFSVGMLIALFERSVGLYASLINVNAYHQPGVESGKKAATAVLALQRRVIAHVASNSALPMTAESIASAIGQTSETEHVFKICEHLSANPSRGLKKVPAGSPTSATYQSQ